MKLWKKNYELNKKIEEFTVGNDYLLDKKLVKYDCILSIAHAKMLCKIGVINKTELKKLVSALKEIIKLNNENKFEIKKEEEDCHTAIENYLTKKLGKTGKKIHTGKSRNDEVLTATRLYSKEEIKKTVKQINELIEGLCLLKKKYGKTTMPGYTHMRKAMPSSISLWSEAFIESMKDNKKLLLNAFALINQSPLGTGAGYGIPLKLDRKLTAKLLGFKKIQVNPVYAQNSRGKFESSILHALSQVMFDLNKMASDILLFSMKEFGYFELPSEICTGSSIMPHKKNPDALEIIKGKYYQIVSFECEIKNLTGNLISGYNRELQLTKEPLMKGFEITQESLNAMKIILKKLKVNKHNCKKAMTPELYSVKKTYEIAKTVAFREAYKKIAKEFE
jgi:argininosuccinate lyase